MEFLYCLSRTRSSDNSVSMAIWEAFGLCTRFQIVMLSRNHIIFSTPYFQVEKRLNFHFVYVMNTYHTLIFYVCLPGKSCELSWKSRGILFSDFCWNTASVSL